MGTSETGWTAGGQMSGIFMIACHETPPTCDVYVWGSSCYLQQQRIMYYVTVPAAAEVLLIDVLLPLLPFSLIFKLLLKKPFYFYYGKMLNYFVLLVKML